MRQSPNQRLKLTGAAVLAFRASTSLQAAPAAWPSRQADEAVSLAVSASGLGLGLGLDLVV